MFQCRGLHVNTLSVLNPELTQRESVRNRSGAVPLGLVDICVGEFTNRELANTLCHRDVFWIFPLSPQVTTREDFADETWHVSVRDILPVAVRDAIHGEVIQEQ